MEKIALQLTAFAEIRNAVFIWDEAIGEGSMGEFTISMEDPSSADAASLMNELSDILQTITGDSGRGSFEVNDLNDPRALFAIVRNEAGEPVGCGAIRPLSDNTAELKRMYAKYKANGIGTGILAYLEEQAKGLGYTAIWLETRLINEQAVAFYEKNGYHRIENYGRYRDNIKAVCFEKCIQHRDS